MELIKVYKVQIDRARKGRWYETKKKQIYECILVSKSLGRTETSSPVFIVLSKNEDEYFVNGNVIRSIHPLDCAILWEDIILNKPLMEFTRTYHKKSMDVD